MARNTRMPDDVAELTAAWKRHHDETERGVKFVGRGEAKAKPKAELRASRGGMPPQTLATALGAEVDPMEEAKKAYRAAANGEVDMPLVTPAMARGIGAGLAGYQGVEAVAGATGVGAAKYDAQGRQIFPIENANRQLDRDMSRFATAGYVADKEGGVPVRDVLFDHALNQKARARKRGGAAAPFTRGVHGSDLRTPGWIQDNRKSLAEYRSAVAKNKNRAEKRKWVDELAEERDKSWEENELARLVAESLSGKKTPSAAAAEIVKNAAPYGLPVVRSAMLAFMRTPTGRKYAEQRGRALIYISDSAKSLDFSSARQAIHKNQAFSIVKYLHSRGAFDRINNLDGISEGNLKISGPILATFATSRPSEIKASRGWAKLEQLSKDRKWADGSEPDLDSPTGDTTTPEQIHRAIVDWFVDGATASAIKKSKTALPDSFISQVMSDGGASAGLRSAVARNMQPEKLVEYGAGAPWMLRDAIDAGGERAEKLRPLLRDSSDPGIRALVARYPDATAAELEALNVTPESVATETQWRKSGKEGGNRGQIEYLGAHFAGDTKDLSPRLRQTLAGIGVLSTDAVKDILIPTKRVNVFETMPLDDMDDLAAFIAENPAHPSLFRTKAAGVADVQSLAKIVASPHVSAQQKADLIRATNEQLQTWFVQHHGSQGAVNAANAAVPLLDMLNLREAWAAHIPAKKRSAAAEENLKLVADLGAAGVDLAQMNADWLDLLSDGKYSRLDASGGAWTLQRRRSLAAALTDMSVYSAPLDNASVAVTLAGADAGRLGSGFDHWGVEHFPELGSTRFRVNYLMRPGGIALGPDTEGFWTDAHTGTSGETPVNRGWMNSSAAYAQVQRLKQLKDLHKLAQSFNVHRFGASATTWTGPSDSPVFPFSLAARYLMNRFRTPGFDKASDYDFGELNLKQVVPMQDLSKKVAAVEVVHSSKGGGTPETQDERAAIEALRETAESFGVDFVESKSDKYRGKDFLWDLPTESEVHMRPEYRHQAAKGGDTPRNARAAEGAGDTKEKVARNGNLSPHGRKRYLFKDRDGKVEGYGTQYSDVRFDPDTRMYVAYPTIVDGRLMSSDDAFAHYQRTGEYFHRTVDEAEARRAAAEAHDESAEDNLAWWNNYIADNLGKGVLAPSLEAMSEDEGFMRWARGEEPDNPMKRVLRQDAMGGEAGEGGAEAVPQGEPAGQRQGGPRIVINPKVFKDKRDALCVAFNEAFRLVMEENGFEPVSEPTEKQRKFFADTAYANDELQLRRTILARIATLDTSVSDPTDEQLEETMEMLEMVMEVGAPQNEWEQQAVQRLHDVVAKSLESTRANGTARQPEPPEETGSAQADEGGGVPSLAERYPEPLLDEDRVRHRAAVQRLARWEIANGPEAPKPYGILRDELALAEIADRNDAYMKRLEEYWERRAGTGLAVKANDGTGVTDPVWAPKRLARQAVSGFSGFLAGAASALDGLFGEPRGRQIRGKTVLNNSPWLTRAADDLAEYSERLRLSSPLPGETAVRTVAEWAPWLALPAPQYTIPAAAYGGTVSSTRRAYDAAWSATGIDPESAGWWMKPELRGAAVAGVAALPMLPVGRHVGKMWDSVAGRVFPSAERAVVPYSPGWAYLQTARQAWSAGHRPLAVGTQIGTAVGTVPVMNYLAEPSEKTLFPLQPGE